MKFMRATTTIGSPRMPATLRAIMTAVIAMSGAMAAQAQQTITVAGYGGSWGDGLKKCVTDPFTVATGIKVILEPGVSSVTLGKIKQQKDNPVYAAAWLDGGVSEGMAEGLAEEITPAAVPALGTLANNGVYRDAAGKVYAVSTGFFSMGLVYNTKEVKTPPTSWFDLWQPQYAGLVIMPGASVSSAAPTIVHLANLLGGSAKNIDPALAKLKQLKVSSWFESSGTASNSLQSGEAIIGSFYHSTVWSMVDKGLPVAFVVPKEGVPANDIRLHIVKGTKQRAEAEKLVNYAISKPAADCLAETLYLGSAIKGMAYSDKAKARMPWGANGSVQTLAPIDWNALVAERAKITERFTKEVVGK